MANAKAYKATPGQPTATQKVGFEYLTLTSPMDSAFILGDHKGKMRLGAGWRVTCMDARV